MFAATHAPPREIEAHQIRALTKKAFAALLEPGDFLA
jgi:hypothetical protein